MCRSQLAHGTVGEQQERKSHKEAKNKEKGREVRTVMTVILLDAAKLAPSERMDIVLFWNMSRRPS